MAGVVLSIEDVTLKKKIRQKFLLHKAYIPVGDIVYIYSHTYLFVIDDE